MKTSARGNADTVSFSRRTWSIEELGLHLWRCKDFGAQQAFGRSQRWNLLWQAVGHHCRCVSVSRYQHSEDHSGGLARRQGHERQFVRSGEPQSPSWMSMSMSTRWDPLSHFLSGGKQESLHKCMTAMNRSSAVWNLRLAMQQEATRHRALGNSANEPADQSLRLGERPSAFLQGRPRIFASRRM